MKLFKRIPKRWALLIYLLLLALLLASAWVLLDYPSLTAASAFRRGLEDADLPVLDLELRANDVGLAADEGKVYVVRLGSGAGWQYYDAWTVPAAEGVLWAPLNWQTAGGFHYKWEEPVPAFAEDFAYEPQDPDAEGFPNTLPETMPAFAVKTSQTVEGLTLVLEDSDVTPQQRIEERSWTGGSYPLVLLEEQNGWYVFGFDMDTLQSARDGYEDYRERWLEQGMSAREASGPQRINQQSTLVDWIQSYKPWRPVLTCPARLELSVLENGSPTTLSWDPVCAGAK